MELTEVAITIDPVTYNWWLFFIPAFALLPFVALTIGCVTTWAKAPFGSLKKKFFNELTGVSLVLTVVSFLLAIATPLYPVMSGNASQIADNQSEALEDQLGWSHVDITVNAFSDSTFVAKSHDGQYVSGALTTTKAQDVYTVLIEE